MDERSSLEENLQSKIKRILRAISVRAFIVLCLMYYNLKDALKCRQVAATFQLFNQLIDIYMLRS